LSEDDRPDANLLEQRELCQAFLIFLRGPRNKLPAVAFEEGQVIFSYEEFDQNRLRVCRRCDRVNLCRSEWNLSDDR
jgi:hypothetical protein